VAIFSHHRRVGRIAAVIVCAFLSIQLPAMAQEVLWKNYFTQAIQALQSNDLETAERMLKAAAEQAQGFGESDPRYCQTYDALAIAYAAEKKFADAERTYQKVLSIKEKTQGGESPGVLLTLSNYADLLFMEGKLKQAEITYQSALKGLESINPALYAEKAQNLGTCLSEEGLFAQAEEALTKARQIEVGLYGANSSQVLSTSVNLINLHETKGAYKQAENEAKETLQALTKLSPPDMKLTDACVAALTAIDTNLGHYAQAEVYAKDLVKHAEARADTPSSDYPRSLERLADVYSSEHKYAEAEPLLQQAKAMLERQLPDHPEMADCLVDLAELYIDLGKYTDAEPLLQKALSIRQTSLGSEHSQVAECLIDIAYIDAQQNRPIDAELAYKKALAIKLKTVGNEHPTYARALCQLGLLYASMHRNDEAESALTEALRLREKILPPDHPDIARNMAQLAGFYKDNNMGLKSEAMYRRLIARDEKYEPDNIAAKTSDLNNLGAVMALLGKNEYATQLQEEASQLRKKVPGGSGSSDDTAFMQSSKGPAEPITDKWCLCIGISNFQDPTINLKYAAKDATDFSNFLVAKGNFKQDHVKLLTDSAATRENILSELGDKWLGKVAKPSDLVLIYISSHGSQAMEKAGGTNFLVAYDSNKSSLLASGIPMQWLSEMVKQQMKSNRIFLILDVCHSGSVAEGEKGLTRTTDIDVSSLTAGEGQIILCSSAADQVSWESKEYPNSVFTKRLIESLQSKGADIHLTDAYKLMKTKVEEEVLRDRSVVQTPIIKENWHGGELEPLKEVH
jgi:Tfp pilus assembly protein PilF